MTHRRAALLALVPVLLHGLAREADRGLGLLLRAEVAPDGLLAEVGRAAVADGAAAVGRVGAWLLGGAGLWLALAWSRRRSGEGWSAALSSEASSLAPLLLRPALSLLALLSVALEPSYPYAYTLPVALTQDWGIGQDAAALATIVALRAPAFRLPAPRAREVFLLTFLAYAVLTPEWAWRWEGHPGNEPKYLRQGVALGLGLTFDAEGVSAAMEELPARPLGEALASGAGRLARESWGMAAALVRGEAGRDAIRAKRITRQTVRGKDGGVYYVLAPGPSLMLAPTLRLDRTVNLARGETGRVAVSVLLWCALGALLVAALFQLVRDATGRAGLGAALAFGFALVPPFLFYFFQFYPEMVGALVLAVAFRTLALRPVGLERHPWLVGWMLAGLPWLHQKFLPVWLALVATSLWVARSPSSRGTASSGGPSPDSNGAPREDGRWRVIAGLLVPTAVSLSLTALYNFAITGSVRPDALFLAWGPGGVTSARVGQGILGLLLDARYGILPYVPVLVLAAAGLAVGGARRFGVVLPAAAVYYLTVAAADNWAGAVCNLGRYVMPVAPLAVALVGMAIARATADPSGADAAGTLGMTGRASALGMERRGVVAVMLILAAWTGLFAVALWSDPHAANDSALLLAKSAFGDGNQYIPNLFIRRWADGAPGLWARILVWLLALVGFALWTRRVSATGARPQSAAPLRVLAGVSAAALVAGLFLEHWPGGREGPRFAQALEVPGGGAPAPLVFVEGQARVGADEAVVGPGEVVLVLRSNASPAALRVTVGGSSGLVRAEGVSPLLLRPSGAVVSVPVFPYHLVRGRGGRSVFFSRTRLEVEGEAVLRVMEPDEAGDR